MFSTESPAPTAIGAVGVALMLLAFVLNLFRVWRLERWPDTFLYSLANFLGGALATASAAMIFYWPFVVYEGIWCFFSGVNCVRLGLRWQRGRSQNAPQRGFKDESSECASSPANASVEEEQPTSPKELTKEERFADTTNHVSV
ncbi:hypothetical protein CCYA_CCYA01G0082 [Cyanidiococcus yangmingshanensis]|uniref:CBU-0592-like domain-containing protein n=1 Tax=Cyanidiococcus yangmingshanensis TaxID=2690220 RepID=A0A7J7IRX2_9RHOD|nr:hypothetical protein F1559_005057 [Cyanidiococcus yangmingshanensis]KAK4529225.1 hypothetical protein CCYA_CCYA01G0082 [Cyanidiococcus yangmingshanensis]